MTNHRSTVNVTAVLKTSVNFIFIALLLIMSGSK